MINLSRQAFLAAAASALLLVGAPFSLAAPFVDAVCKLDLVILNRFGRAEIQDGRLIGVLSGELTDAVPIAVAVPEGLREAWIAGTGGLPFPSGRIRTC